MAVYSRLLDTALLSCFSFAPKWEFIVGLQVDFFSLGWKSSLRMLSS